MSWKSDVRRIYSSRVVNGRAAKSNVGGPLSIDDSLMEKIMGKMYPIRWRPKTTRVDARSPSPVAMYRWSVCSSGAATTDGISSHTGRRSI